MWSKMRPTQPEVIGEERTGMHFRGDSLFVFLMSQRNRWQAIAFAPPPLM